MLLLVHSTYNMVGQGFERVVWGHSHFVAHLLGVAGGNLRVRHNRQRLSCASIATEAFTTKWGGIAGAYALGSSSPSVLARLLLPPLLPLLSSSAALGAGTATGSPTSSSSSSSSSSLGRFFFLEALVMMGWAMCFKRLVEIELFAHYDAKASIERGCPAAHQLCGPGGRADGNNTGQHRQQE